MPEIALVGGLILLHLLLMILIFYTGDRVVDWIGNKLSNLQMPESATYDFDEEEQEKHRESVEYWMKEYNGETTEEEEAEDRV